jgi:hypothetical protein
MTAVSTSYGTRYKDSEAGGGGGRMSLSNLMIQETVSRNQEPEYKDSLQEPGTRIHLGSIPPSNTMRGHPDHYKGQTVNIPSRSSRHVLIFTDNISDC